MERYGSGSFLDPPEPPKPCFKAETGVLQAVLQIIPGAGHGGPEFRDEQRAALILEMLDEELAGRP